MQSRTSLKRRLKALVDVIEAEAMQNAAFGEKLVAALGIDGGIKSTHVRRTSARAERIEIPDVFRALQEKGDEEFGFWLRTFDLAVLRAIVKQNGFDPAKSSQRWKEGDKFIALIEDQTQARLRRGAAFLSRKATHND